MTEPFFFFRRVGFNNSAMNMHISGLEVDALLFNLPMKVNLFTELRSYFVVTFVQVARNSLYLFSEILRIECHFFIK